MYRLANPTAHSQLVLGLNRAEASLLPVDVAAGPVAVGFPSLAAGVVHIGIAGQSVLVNIGVGVCVDWYVLDGMAMAVVDIVMLSLKV